MTLDEEFYMHSLEHRMFEDPESMLAEDETLREGCLFFEGRDGTYLKASPMMLSRLYLETRALLLTALEQLEQAQEKMHTVLGFETLPEFLRGRGLNLMPDDYLMLLGRLQEIARANGLDGPDKDGLPQFRVALMEQVVPQLLRPTAVSEPAGPLH